MRRYVNRILQMNISSGKQTKERTICKLEYWEREEWGYGWQQCLLTPDMQWSSVREIWREQAESFRAYAGQISRLAATHRLQTHR
jgi:hypothetical protein